MRKLFALVPLLALTALTGFGASRGFERGSALIKKIPDSSTRLEQGKRPA